MSILNRQNSTENSKYFDMLLNFKDYLRVVFHYNDLSFVADFHSHAVAIANASAMAIIAQNISSKQIIKKGSPNWLKGVKNSQKRNERKNTRPAIRHARGLIPCGHAGASHR